MNSDSKPNSFEEEARVLIEKQEEFKAKIIAERSMYMARIIELDELLAKLGGVKKYKPRQKVNEGENGGEASAPLDDEEEAILAMDYLDSNGALLPIPENWMPDPTLDKKSQIIEIIRMKGPQLRGQIIRMYPHANSKEKARTWAPLSELTRSGRLVENKDGQLTIPKR
jgi:hypothetical protein